MGSLHKGTTIYSVSLKDVENDKYINQEMYNQMSKEDKRNIRLIVKSYKVFNAEQIEGIEQLPVEEYLVNFNNEVADKFSSTLVRSMNISVVDEQQTPFYDITKDYVNMPLKSSFASEEAYYSTLFHELAHATSHESRLNRVTTFGKQSYEYAIEELRAEFAATFLSMEVGFHLDTQHEQNHKTYIQSWMAVLKNNPKVLFDCIKDAQTIESYMQKKGNLLEIKKEYKNISTLSLEDSQTEATSPHVTIHYNTRDVKKISDIFEEVHQKIGENTDFQLTLTIDDEIILDKDAFSTDKDASSLVKSIEDRMNTIESLKVENLENLHGGLLKI